MKVTELFEAAQGEPGQGGKHRGGAYYPPSYDADSKMLRGSVLDWMDKAGITKDDIAQAIEQIKKDPLIAKLADQGLKLVEKPASEKNGTLNFAVTRQYTPDGKKHKGLYQVHANGQIRSSGDSWFAAHQGKLKSPKPRLKAGDSVGSLLMIYKAALQELLDKKKKDIVKEDCGAVVKKVFDSLGAKVSDSDRKKMTRDIERKTEEGWTPSEIVSHMRNMEEVNPDLDEDKALANMKRISDAVKKRLGK